MSKKHIVRRSVPTRRKTKTDWKRVDRLTESQVAASAASDADAMPTDSEFWKTAKLVTPERKAPVSLRLDQDVLDWFKAQGRGYQSRINAVLRAYMSKHRKAG